MIPLNKIILILLSIYMFVPVLSNDDSTLFVKTSYQHEIFNGRNTARKIAIKQEMRDSKGELFREVFYDKNTKQIDYILYYFYTTQGIRLIEKVDINEKLIEYYKYKYKKARLQSIEHFAYDTKKDISQLLSIHKYLHKKNNLSIKKYDKNNKLLNAELTTHKNKLAIKTKINDYQSDSAHIKIISKNYENKALQFEKEIVISSNNDTTALIHKFSYNENLLVDSITTSNDNNEVIKYKLFKYFPGGDIKNERIIGANNYYFQNITYDKRKYYRELPKKKPDF